MELNYNEENSKHNCENEENQNDNSIDKPTTSTNVNINELDPETHAKLRGDAIGDTLYSQSFVLKTLLQFSDLDWNEQVEEELCFLWDMTVEKDVCRYLFEVSYPSLACSALIKYDENRFIEIIIGILGNMLCVEPEKTVSDDEANIVLQKLDSDDPLILIQVMRFISAFAHQSKKLQVITEDIMEKIKFILLNSMNNDLLMKTLEALVKLTLDFKIQHNLVNLELFNISLNSYRTLMYSNDDEFTLESKDKLLICRYMLEIVCNICAYVDHFDNCQLLLDIQRNADKFSKEIINIVNYFSNEQNLFPVSEELIFFFQLFQYTLVTLNVNYFSALFISFCNILVMITDTRAEYPEFYETVIELTIFLLSRGKLQIVKKDLNRFSTQEIKILLNIVCENQHKFTYNVDVTELISSVQ